MSARSKIVLPVVAIAVVVGIVGVVSYDIFWKERLRPATPDEVAAHLQGDWSGVSVNNVQESRKGIITIRRLDGNRIEGEEDWENATLCPDKVFSGIFAENKVSWEFTYVNASPGLPGYCNAKGHTDLEMKIGEDGTPHLIGSWEVEGWWGRLELTKAR